MHAESLISKAFSVTKQLYYMGLGVLVKSVERRLWMLEIWNLIPGRDKPMI